MQPDAIDRVLKTTTIRALEALTDGTCEIVDPDSTGARPVALTPPRDLDSDTICRFTALILDPQSWCYAKKRCIPRPTAVFRMGGTKGNITVTVGFSCVGWIITAPAERRGGSFDPVQHHIREILKSIFPEYASPDHRSMWRSGTISALKKQRTEHETEA